MLGRPPYGCRRRPTVFLGLTVNSRTNTSQAPSVIRERRLSTGGLVDLGQPFFKFGEDAGARTTSEIAAARPLTYVTVQGRPVSIFGKVLG
jgi:hypothetical protein